MTTTLRHVAELARVSVKTVSNVVNDNPHVSEDLRRRVEDAIRQLGYRPNVAARALRTGRSGLVALAVPDVEAPWLPGLTDQIVGQAAQSGFGVVIEPVGAAVTAARTPDQPRVDAVVLSAETGIPEPAGPRFPAATPVVVLAPGLDPRYDCVAVDAAAAARDATEHLLRIGRRRIAAVGAHPHGPPQPRTLGYTEAMRRAGLRLPAAYLAPVTGPGRADGYRAAERLLTGDDRPDAILCYHDRLAGGVLRAAADRGLRVPEDLAVIGMGDSEEGRYSRPTLSTVAADPALVAREALELLARRLRDPAAPAGQVVVPHAVIRRESTTTARPIRLSST